MEKLDLTKFKDCFLCEKVSEMHTYPDFNILLANVSQKETNYNTSCKEIMKFECLVCVFKTTDFNEWKCHIMSMSHMTICHTIDTLYSHLCFYSNCKTVLYGTSNSLYKHMEESHSTNFVVFNISVLMAKVMELYINNTNTNPLYFCSHCIQMSYSPIHTNKELIKENTQIPIKYFCSFCNLVFLSNSELIDYHSLTTEHIILKSISELSVRYKTDKNRITPFDQLNKEMYDNNKSQVIQNKLFSSGIKLPMILLNRFEEISQYQGECKLCKNYIIWEPKSILNHLFLCKFKYDLTDPKKTIIKEFKCTVCDYFTDNIDEHKAHITSYIHLTNCHDTNDYYSYFCKICNMYMYGHKFDIINHWKLNHKDTDTAVFSLPTLSTFMATILNNFNQNSNREEIIHYFGDKAKNNPKVASYQCLICKVEFHTSISEYNMHKITSEHIILTFLTTNTNIISSITNRFQSEGDTKDTDYEYLQNNEINENETSVNYITSYQKNLTDNAQKIQKSGNSVCKEENDTQNNTILNTNINTELTPNYKKSQYKQYFERIINKTNINGHFENLTTKTYYCDDCDFIVEDETLWNQHNLLKHGDINRHATIYCPSCSMYITGNNNEKHNSTFEHWIILEFLKTLGSIKKGLIQSINFVKSCNLNDETTRPIIKKQLELNNVKEIIKHQHDKNDTNLPTFMTNTILDKNLDENKFDNNKSERRICDDIVSTSNNSFDILPTLTNQLTVDQTFLETIEPKDKNNS